jgi:hypothetical protein
MRLTLVVVGALLLLVTAIWFFRPGPMEPAELAPSSLLGMVVVNKFPESLDFLPQTRLGEWLDLEPTEIEERLSTEWLDSLKEQVDQAILVIHTLQRKESGALRPHFTVFLWPRSGQGRAVESWIKGEVIKRFGKDSTTIREEGPVQVMRGSKKGEILYLSREKGWVIASNSESGWKDVQLTLANRAPSLADGIGFREIRNNIEADGDLFFYYSGQVGGFLLPEFGYSVIIEGEEVSDLYWSKEPSQ